MKPSFFLSSFLLRPSSFVLRTSYFVLAALSAAMRSVAADAGYTLGVPSAPTLRRSESAADNAWLAANK